MWNIPCRIFSIVQDEILKFEGCHCDCLIITVDIGSCQFDIIEWLWCYYGHHYFDVIMTMMASQITSLTVVYSTVYSDADQRKHQSSTSLAFVWGIHRDRWIPHAKGQLRGRCFHLMTSSCTARLYFSWYSCITYWYKPFKCWAHTNWSSLCLQMPQHIMVLGH